MEDGRPSWMQRSAVSRPSGPGGGPPPFGGGGLGGDSGLPECGDFKRGACFRATCKFMHNGRPASEFAGPGVPGSQNNGAAGLPTPKAAGAFVAPDDLDLNLWDPNTGFGLFGTPTFGTRYGMIGNLPKIENVRPLCMDFFKQGFCNRRGPHNQGCLFRHDEIEGKGKIPDAGMVVRVTETVVQLFTVEAQGRVGIMSGKEAKSDVAAAAVEYAKRREEELQAEERRAKELAERKAAQEAAAAEAEEANKAAAAEAAAAGASTSSTAAFTASGEAPGGAEAPLPAGWKATKAADGRTYYYHSATKKTQWTRPKPEEGPGADDAGAPVAAAPAASVAPLPAGWKEAKAPDGRTYYYAPGEKTRWTRPTAPAGAPSAAAAPGASAADGAAPAADAPAADALESAAPTTDTAPAAATAVDDDDDAPALKRQRQDE